MFVVLTKSVTVFLLLLLLFLVCISQVLAAQRRHRSNRLCSAAVNRDNNVSIVVHSLHNLVPKPRPLLSHFTVQEFVRRPCDETCRELGSDQYQCSGACDTSGVYCTCDESDYTTTNCGRRLGSKMCGCELTQPSVGALAVDSLSLRHKVHFTPEDQKFARYVARSLTSDALHPVYQTIAAKAAHKLALSDTTDENPLPLPFWTYRLPSQTDIPKLVRGETSVRPTALDILTLRGHAYQDSPFHSAFGYMTPFKKSNAFSVNIHDAIHSPINVNFFQAPMLATDENNPWYEPSAGNFVLKQPGQCHGPLCWNTIAQSVCTAGHAVEENHAAQKRQALNFEVLSEEPRIFFYPNFLSESEIKRYLEVGLKNTNLSQKRIGENLFWKRYVKFLPPDEVKHDPILQGLFQRVAIESKLPRENFHFFKLMHYHAPSGWKSDQKEYYYPHHDARGAPRAATFIFYLTDVEEGGETIFVDLPSRRRNGTMPHLSAAVDLLDPKPEDIRNGFIPLSTTPWRLQTPSIQEKFEAACRSEHYLKIKPKRGAALLFYNHKPNGNFDDRMDHGACPVHQGDIDKVIGQLWINTIPFVEEQKHSTDGNSFHAQYRIDKQGRKKDLKASNY